MKDRTGWTRGDTGPQRIGSKTYQRLAEFTRPCSACKQPFSIFVTERIAEGLAESNNFGLRNCELHRRGGVPANNAELSTLRHKDNTMRDEVAGLYAFNKELGAEVKALKAKLDAAAAKVAEYEFWAIAAIAGAAIAIGTNEDADCEDAVGMMTL